MQMRSLLWRWTFGKGMKIKFRYRKYVEIDLTLVQKLEQRMKTYNLPHIKHKLFFFHHILPSLCVHLAFLYRLSLAYFIKL